MYLQKQISSKSNDSLWQHISSKSPADKDLQSKK